MRSLLFIFVLGIAACGGAAKSTHTSSNLPHVSEHDDVADVVTGSMSAPDSPGLNGPSTPGGTGAGGGTPRPR